MDVYIRAMNGEKKLLMGGVSGQYRVKGWYLDEKGRCYVRTTTGITGLDGDGNPLYDSPLSGFVTDMCCMEEGGVILLIQTTEGERLLAELDPDTGSTTPIENVTLDGVRVYIGALDNTLLILNDKGVWQVDLKKGTRELMLLFTGSMYTLELSKGIADFWSDGSGVGLLWDSGKSERLEWADMDDSREVITVRAAYPDKLKKALNLFNQTSDTYYAVLEESGLDEMDLLQWSGSLTDFLTETNLMLASGKGADIICSDAVYDVYGLMEKGVFADLAPLMEASGIREENYFPAAFDAWKDGGKIYGIVPYVRVGGKALDKAVLNGREELTIESFVDSLLEFKEDRCLQKHWDGADIMNYFLQGSEDFFGMVDWEKGTCDFHGELFSRMLQAAKRYGADEARRQYPESIFFRETVIWSQFDIARKLEAKNQMGLGWFFDDGNYPQSCIIQGNNYVMGINAKSAHTEGAWEVLSFLLGEEAQAAIDELAFLFPVNKNAFERLAQAELESQIIIQGSHNGNTHTTYIPGRGGESRIEEMRQMLSEARTFPYRTEPLLDIIMEETAYYFNEGKSEEEVIALVQNRVQLYLDEHAKK